MQENGVAGETMRTHGQTEEYPDDGNETEMVVQVDNTPTKQVPRRSQRVYNRESEKEAFEILAALKYCSPRK